jgi:hypothetical protein
MEEIEILRKEFEEHVLEDRADREEIKKMFNTIELKLEPILDVYRSVLLSKSFVMGLAGVILAITAIGAGFVWLINSAIQK